MVHCQEIIWMVRWRVQQTVLAEVRKKLETVEEGGIGRQREGETDCGP